MAHEINLQSPKDNQAQLDALESRLAGDAGYAKALLADPAAALRELGFDLDFDLEALGDPVIFERPGGPTLAFIRSFGSMEASQAAASAPVWPWRYCYLENQTGVALNLETWAHEGLIGLQEHAISVPAWSTGGFRVAQLVELILNKCNMASATFLVRRFNPERVLGESWNMTCGNVVNMWSASVEGNEIRCVESHPVRP